jgi:hypothetical protein
VSNPDQTFTHLGVSSTFAQPPVSSSILRIYYPLQLCSIQMSSKSLLVWTRYGVRQHYRRTSCFYLYLSQRLLPQRYDVLVEAVTENSVEAYEGPPYFKPTANRRRKYSPWALAFWVSVRACLHSHPSSSFSTVLPSHDNPCGQLRRLLSVWCSCDSFAPALEVGHAALYCCRICVFFLFLCAGWVRIVWTAREETVSTLAVSSLRPPATRGQGCTSSGD